MVVDLGEPPAADRLAAWAASFAWDTAPAAAVHEAKRCLVDVVGCALAGARHPTSSRVRNHAEAVLPKGACTTALGAATGPLAAAQINGTAAHVWDHDDTCYEGIVHPSAIVWPAVQAAVELKGGSGSTLLSAFIAGVEVELAVARGIGPGLYDRGWWNTSVLGAIGAAAGAGRGLGLAPETLSHAIRLAAAFASGTRVVLGSQAKPFGAGQAARAGLEAALAARAGITGPPLVFEEHRGMAAVLNGSRFDASALAIGERWGLMDPGIAFKLFPACSAMQAAAEALLSLRAEHGLTPANVEGVRCEVTNLVAISLTHDRPATVQEAQFSMNFAMACALMHGGFGIEHLEEQAFRAPAAVAFMPRVTMAEIDDLAASPSDKVDFPEAARIIVTTVDGRRFERTVMAASGMPKNKADDGRLSAKFRRNAASRLDTAAMAGLESRLWSIEECRDVRLPRETMAART